MKEKIRFRDLSLPLKIGIVSAWVIGLILLLAIIDLIAHIVG